MADGDWEDIAFGPPAGNSSASGDGWEDIAFGPPATNTSEPATLSPWQTARNEFLSFGNRAVEGVADLASLGQTIARRVNPLISIFEKFAPQPDSGDVVKDLAREGYLYGDEKAQTPFGRVAGEVGYMLPSVAIPGGTLPARAASAVAGGLGTGLAKEVTDNPWAHLGAGVLGSLAPAAISSTAQKLASGLTSGADDLERSALNITRADYTRSRKFQPKGTVDEAPLDKALKAVRERGLFKGSKDPQEIAFRNQAFIEKFVDDVSKLTSKADEVSKDVFIPDFSSAEKFIAKADDGSKPALREQLNRYMFNFNQNSDGSLTYVNQQKKALGKKAYSGLTDSKDLDKAITADLRSTVEKGVARELEKEAGKSVGELNEKAAQHITLSKIFEKAVDEDVKSGSLSTALRRASVSPLGGTALGGLASFVTGNPLPILAGAAAGLANTRSGKFAIGDVLRGGSGLLGLIPEVGVGSALPSIGQTGISQLQSAKDQTVSMQQLPNSLEKSEATSPTNQVLSQAFNQIAQTSPKKSTETLFEFTPETAVEGVGMDNGDANYKNLVQAVIMQESGGKADAVSKAGARGLMQIMPATAKEIAKELGFESYDLNDPETNQVFGEHYLQKMIKMFDGDIKLALAAYNAGPGKVGRIMKEQGVSTFEEVFPYLPRETQKYVPSILKRKQKLDVTMV